MKVGIIGAGKMAEKMATTIKKLENSESISKVVRQMQEVELLEESNVKIPEVECTAIAARDGDRAEKFAEKYGFCKAYDSYEKLITDEDVDLIYIALPHSLHFEWTQRALEAGKNVLCEKAFALNRNQAEKMIGTAKEKGLFLAEAIWTRYMPSRKIIENILKCGEIGKIQTISANLGYPVSGNKRLIEKELGGGALLDLAVYPLNFASMIIGNEIKKMSAVYVKDKSGVDGQNQIVLTYGNEQMASLFTSMYTMTDRTGWVYGEKGILEVQNINNPEVIRLYRHRKDYKPFLEREYKVPIQISGYEYEVVACAWSISNEKTECSMMPWSETLEIMGQLDKIRSVWREV